MSIKPCNPDLLRAAAEGYCKPGAANPHIWSSNMWEAFEIGIHMHHNLMGIPSHAYKSRGSQYLINYHRFEVKYKNGSPAQVILVEKVQS